MTHPPDDPYTTTGEFLALPDPYLPAAYAYQRAGYAYGPAAYPPPLAPDGDLFVFEPDGPSGEVPPTDQRPAGPLSQLHAALVFLWAGCLVGAVTSPFLDYIAYTASNTGFGGEVVASIDGWGQVSTNGAATDGHGLVFGIPLVICAGALFIAIVGLATGRWARLPALLGTLASAALVVVALFAFLYWDAESSTAASAIGLRWRIGNGLWLAVLVGLVSLFTTALGLRAILDDSSIPPPDAELLDA